MAEESISTHKARFSTGNRPTQQHFHDVFDSYVHKDDQESVTTGAINQAIDNFEADLKAESPDAVVNTLGDVFKVFQGYSDQRNLHSELQWANIPGRPTAAVPLSYSAVQRIALWNFNLTDWPATGGTSSSRIKSLKQLANIAEDVSITIVDMHLIRNSVVEHTTGAVLTITTLNMVDIGLNPRTAV